MWGRLTALYLSYGFRTLLVRRRSENENQMLAVSDGALANMPFRTGNMPLT